MPRTKERISGSVASRLKSFPQFQAAVAPIMKELSADVERRRMLSECIAPNIRNDSFQGKPTGLDRFLNNAISAIGTYEQQRKASLRFDRGAAADRLSNAAAAFQSAITELSKIEQWSELEGYIEDIYCEPPLTASNRLSPQKVLQSKLRARDRRQAAYRRFGVRPAGAALTQLASAVEIARERIRFQPGDSQRDDVARHFVDEMVHAWLSGTGEMPTYARLSPRSRNPSPFAKLLQTVNERCLPPAFRSNNNFREHAQKSIKRLRSVLALV